MSEKLSYGELYKLALEHFGKKLTNPTSDRQNQEMTAALYDSFIMLCSIDPQRQSFGAVILLSDDASVDKFFGRQVSLDNDRESILESFALIEEYCRLRLPDKFLERYDQAHNAD